MRITLNRSELQQFERLTAKLVGTKNLPTVATVFSNDNGIPVISAHCPTGALTLTLSSSPIALEEPLMVPWPLLKELAAKRSGTVELEMAGQQTVALWNENGVPQQRSAPRPEVEPLELAPAPEQFATFTHQFCDAFVQATHCIDPDSHRYALGGVALQGSKSRIVATDGRQLLVQNGFGFPWENDLLCPASSIFASKELRECGKEINVGYADTWICFEVGNVLFRLKEIEGKYPNVDSILQETGERTRLNLDPDDAVFVAKHLENLPGKTEADSPVYVELGQWVGVRGHDTKQEIATELRLEKSNYHGTGLIARMNRKFLKRALDLNFESIRFDSTVFPPDSKESAAPAFASNDSAVYIWMPLSGSEPMCDQNNISVVKTGSMNRSTRPSASVVSSAAANTAASPTQAAATATDIVQTQVKPTGDKRKHSAPMTKSEFDVVIANLHTMVRNLKKGIGELAHEHKQSRMRESELRKREQKIHKREAEIAKGQAHLRQTAALLGKL